MPEETETSTSEVIGEIRLVVKNDDIILDSSFENPADIVYFLRVFETAFLNKIVSNGQ